MVHSVFRSRVLPSGSSVTANEAGRFFCDCRSDKSESSLEYSEFLAKNGFISPNDQSLELISTRIQLLARKTALHELDYLVLVPTLRCDLNCSYCQVSRAHEYATGFDWSDKTLSAVLEFIDRLSTESIKIEFQGGEPTLRLDLLEAVIERAERFKSKQFVICTNLSKLTPEFLKLLERKDVTVSTSLDGSKLTHRANRTATSKMTDTFFANFDFLLTNFGAEKVSALPTINLNKPPPIDELIDEYSKRGLSSIYLRPINYQGFARKRHAESRELSESWWTYYESFLSQIIERNWQNRAQILEESYFSLCLRRIFRIGLDRHVDLRNPNPVGVDYALIDYDGKIYPSDEARMLTRSGVMDLSIGDVWKGFDTEQRSILNDHSTNYGDPICDRCMYQPYCGRDLIDDLSRYGRIDIPRDETAFCKKHLRIFDTCFDMIYSENPKVQYSLAKWLGLSGDQLPQQLRVL